MRRLMFLILFVGLLVGCGGSPAASPAAAPAAAPTAETRVSATDTPETITQQLVTALAAQDKASILNLFDTGLATRNAERERIMRDWANRQHPDRSGLPCPTTLGMLKGQDFAPAVMSGETATVRVTLHHDKGDAWLDVSLRQTADGWRIFAWSSINACQRQ